VSYIQLSSNQAEESLSTSSEQCPSLMSSTYWWVSKGGHAQIHSAPADAQLPIAGAPLLTPCSAALAGVLRVNALWDPDDYPARALWRCSGVGASICRSWFAAANTAAAAATSKHAATPEQAGIDASQGFNSPDVQPLIERYTSGCCVAAAAVAAAAVAAAAAAAAAATAAVAASSHQTIIEAAAHCAAVCRGSAAGI
jgi:hypothetical protein